MKLKNLFSRKQVVSAIRLSGVIKSGNDGLSLENIKPALDKAFSRKQKAVALIINSPGGSPVQSSLIGKYINKLSEENQIPVIAFVEDVAASGGYWLACAADEIYADENSIIGSIGVVGGGFGFHQFIEKHGIERRIYTSGKNKVNLDPFKRENPEDVIKLKAIQQEIHENFIKHVKLSRSESYMNACEKFMNDGIVQSSDEFREILFNGDFWTGKKAVELGLIDGIDDIHSYFNDYKIRWIKTDNGGWFKRKLGISIDLLFNKVEHFLLMNKLGI